MFENLIKKNKLEALYPFSHHYLEVEGGKIHYVDEGQGEVILCVHGNPTWSFYYRNIVNRFKEDHRVIAIDHMGCGLSDKPQKYEYTLDNHIKNLIALIEKLNLKDITLVVHDWGGAIGFGAATRRPELFKKFVVLNTAAFHLDSLPTRINWCRRPKLWAKFFVRGFNGFAWPATFMTTEKPLSKELKAGYIAPYNSFKNRVAVYNFVQDIPMEENHKTRPVLDAVEKGLALFKNHPMLILWGGKDFCFHDEFYHQWVGHFPRAKRQYYEDAGHYVIEDKKDETLEEIHRFLGE